jgi:hypothetical protein
MDKEFVSYKLALELKNLGFDEPCFGLFVSMNNKLLIKEIPNQQESEQYFGGILAPTFQQAFCFFREKYNLIHEILLDRTSTPKYCYQLYRYKDFGDFEEIKINVSDWFLYRTYEESELECLIKLIEIVKNEK